MDDPCSSFDIAAIDVGKKIVDPASERILEILKGTQMRPMNPTFSGRFFR